MLVHQRVIEFSIIIHAFLGTPHLWKPPFRQRLIYPLVESQTRSSTAASWPAVHLGAGRLGLQSHYLLRPLGTVYNFLALYTKQGIFEDIHRKSPLFCFFSFTQATGLDVTKIQRSTP